MGKRPRHDHLPTDQQDADEGDAREQPDASKETPAEQDRLDLLVVIGLALLGDAPALEAVAVVGLDHPRAAYVVLESRVEAGDDLTDRLVLRLDPREKAHACEADDRDGEDDDECERGRERIEDDGDTAYRRDDADDLADLRAEKLLKSVDVVV